MQLYTIISLMITSFLNAVKKSLTGKEYGKYTGCTSCRKNGYSFFSQKIFQDANFGAVL